LSLDCEKSEGFRFMSADATVAEAASLFKESLKRHSRLGAVFVTEDGKRSQKLLGLLTVWDIAGTEFF